MFEGKQRIIQEFVPGKQVTLAHLIANPKINICLPPPQAGERSVNKNDGK